MKTTEIKKGRVYHNGKTGPRSYSEREVLDIVNHHGEVKVKFKQLVGRYKGEGFSITLSSFASWAKGEVSPILEKFEGRRSYITVKTPEVPKKSHLKRKVERLIEKAEKQGYIFNDLQLSIFEALGSGNWDEEKINWLVLEQFERLYARFYPNK